MEGKSVVLTQSELVLSLQKEVRILLHLAGKIDRDQLDYRPTPKQRNTLELLKYYYNTKNDVLILACSGTGAMEGSVSNLVSPGERILVGTAGKFGERWLDLAKAYGIEAVKVESPYGQPVNIEAMKQKLADDFEAKKEAVRQGKA